MQPPPPKPQTPPRQRQSPGMPPHPQPACLPHPDVGEAVEPGLEATVGAVLVGVAADELAIRAGHRVCWGAVCSGRRAWWGGRGKPGSRVGTTPPAPPRSRRRPQGASVCTAALAVCARRMHSSPGCVQCARQPWLCAPVASESSAHPGLGCQSVCLRCQTGRPRSRWL